MKFTIYPDVAALKAAKSFAGIYLFEVGEFVKIGRSSAMPSRVLRQMREIGIYSDRKLGRIALSCRHVNWRQNEGELHRLLVAFRQPGTEVFKLGLERALSLANEKLEFLSESQLRRFERAEQARRSGAQIQANREFFQNYWASRSPEVVRRRLAA